MNKTLQWTLGLSAVLIALAIVFSIVMPFIAPQLGWNNGYGYGMMGPGHMFGGRGMMGGFGMPFFGFGMILWPVLFVGLIVLASSGWCGPSPHPARTPCHKPRAPTAASPCRLRGKPARTAARNSNGERPVRSAKPDRSF